MSICAEYDWCEHDHSTGPDAEFGIEGHFGPLVDAKAGESSVRVYGSYLIPIEEADTDIWTATLDLSEWSITASTVSELASVIDREFADLRSIVDQMETAVRAWHASLGRV